MTIYSDNGAARGLRTRLFREASSGGVECMYFVDYAAGSHRWYGFGAMGHAWTLADLLRDTTIAGDLSAISPRAKDAGFDKLTADQKVTEANARGLAVEACA